MSSSIESIGTGLSARIAPLDWPSPPILTSRLSTSGEGAYCPLPIFTPRPSPQAERGANCTLPPWGEGDFQPARRTQPIPSLRAPRNDGARIIHGLQ
jgi:hypothetical protein